VGSEMCIRDRAHTLDSPNVQAERLGPLPRRPAVCVATDLAHEIRCQPGMWQIVAAAAVQMRRGEIVGAGHAVTPCSPPHRACRDSARTMAGGSVSADAKDKKGAVMRHPSRGTACRSRPELRSAGSAASASVRRRCDGRRCRNTSVRFRCR
jgi:hypothetical protein